MNKKRKLIGIVLLINIFFLCTGCQKNRISENDVYDASSLKENLQEHFEGRTAYLEKEDGWVYYLEEEKIFGKDDEISEHQFFIDAVNMKYDHLEEFNAPIIEGSKIIGHMEGTPFFSLNKNYLEELYKIDEFLLDLHVDDGNVKPDDLKKLDVSILKKKDILTLINKLRKEDFISNASDGLSKYADLPVDGTEQGQTENGEKVQVRYVAGLAGLRLFRCEVIDAGGTYLSDKVENGKATKKERQRQKWLKKIEKMVLKKQRLDIRQYFPNIEDTCVDCVLDLLEQLETKANKANEVS